MTSRPYYSSKRALFTWLLVSSVFLLLVPHDVTGKLQSLVTGVFSLPLRLGRIATLAARAPLAPTAVSPAEFKKLQLDNQELVNHVETLRALLSDKQAEIDRLAQLRSTPVWERTAFIPADAFHNLDQDLILINRGQADGVEEGQYVLASNAVLGSIQGTPQRRQARVALLSNQDSLIPAYIQSEQVLGMVTGMGLGQIKVANVTRDQTVNAGDLVYAQVRPGLLEHPFLIGAVEEVNDDRNNPLLLDITVRSAAPLSEVFKVTVLRDGE